MAVRLGRLRRSGKEATEAPLDGDSLAALATLRLREHGPLLVVLCVSAFLNFWNLSANGYGNSYYAAAVRSMTQSWHNFFFASFDPGGFITVDKPPVALWVQAASAKVFGFSGTSLLLPEALAGVASVLVLYLAVSRIFGRTAGLVAALALALTPMSVAINRSNNLDAWLALCTTVAAYCVVRALEKGNWPWLVLSGVMIGVAFNTKTLAGFVAAPALFASYLATAPVSLRQRLVHCTVAGVVLLGISASWVAVVDLTPASSRPWVGGSQENTELDLLLNYNGLGRIDGEGNGPGGGVRPPGGDAPRLVPNRQAADGAVPSVDGASPTLNDVPQTDAGGQLPRGFPGGPGGPGGGAGFGAGEPGVLRLFNKELAAQASWLLPLAILGGLASLLSFERRLKGNQKLGSLIVWGGWLLIAGAVFSKAQGIFHPYYLAYLGPAIGGVVGISAATFWQTLRAGDRRVLLAPVALIATAAFEVTLIDSYATWLEPVVVVGVAAGSIALIASVLRPSVARLAAAGLVVALAVVLLPPAVWSYSVIGDAGNANLPYVAPGSTATLQRGRADGPGNAERVNQGLVNYLKSNRGNATWLAATESSMSASGIIIATGEPVMAMGGFSGGDPAITADGVAKLVDDGELRFFLLGGIGGIGGAGGPPGADARPGAVDRPLRPGDNPAADGNVPPVNGYAPLPAGDIPSGLAMGPGMGNRGVSMAITTACKTVDASAYGGSAAASGGPETASGVPAVDGGPGGALKVYDCHGSGDAIRAAAKGTKS